MPAASPPTAKAPKPLLTSQQLREWLGISEWMLDDLIKNDPTFPIERIGRGQRLRRRFDEDKVRAWMAQDSKAA